MSQATTFALCDVIVVIRALETLVNYCVGRPTLQWVPRTISHRKSSCRQAILAAVIGGRSASSCTKCWSVSYVNTRKLYYINAAITLQGLVWYVSCVNDHDYILCSCLRRLKAFLWLFRLSAVLLRESSGNIPQSHELARNPDFPTGNAHISNRARSHWKVNTLCKRCYISCHIQ